MKMASRKTAGIRLGWHDLKGRRATWQEILTRLNSYSLGEALDYLTRVSAVLFNASVGRSREQRYLCGALLGDQADAIWGIAAKYAGLHSSDDGPVILFDHVAVSLATKFALRNLPPESRATGASLVALGEALLMLNDHIDVGPLIPTDRERGSRAALEKWAYYVYVNGIFRHDDNALHALARTFDIFLADRPTLRERHNGFNLPDLVVKSHTGLTPDQLWAVLIALNAHFTTITTANATTATGAISRAQYFGRRFNFTTEEIDSFFALVARDVAETAEIVMGLYSITDPRPFHVLPFEERPIVVVGELAYAPLVWLLFQRLTDGVYHLLFNALPPSERTRYTRYIGFVFEDYVDRLIVRALDRATSGGLTVPNYVGADAVLDAVSSRSAEVCDGILVYENSAVLIEAKARLLPVSARSGLDRQTFVERVGENIAKAAAQLDSTIAHIRAGTFARLGIDPDKIRSFHPINVSLAPFPVQVALSRWMQDVIRQRGVLQQAETTPMEILHIGDLEHLAGLIEKGLSLADFFARKAASAEWREHSTNNFAYFTKEEGYADREPYLEALYLRLAEQATEFLRSRGMQADDEDANPTVSAAT